MIKLKIFTGEKDESKCVFIQEEGKEKKQLNFDAIKLFSVMLLDAIVDENDSFYEVSIDDNNLLTYKQTVEKVFESIIEDSELQNIYKELKQQKNA